MRYLRQFSKLLWVANLALLGVVVVVAFALINSRPLLPNATGGAGLASEDGAAAAPAESRSQKVDTKLILERDIFGGGPEKPGGKSGVQASAASAAKKEEEKPELPVRLLGTAAAEAGNSYAVLENLGTKAQDLYRVGDMISNVRLDTIEQNRVVVSHLGRRQVLDLVLTPQAAAPVSVAANSAAAPPAPAVPLTGDGLVRVVSDSERQINTRAGTADRARASQMLSKMKLSPTAVAGQSDGLRISGLKDSPVAGLIGMRDGDVVQSINGQAVPNQRRAAQVLRKARGADSVQLQIRRGQENKSITFHPRSW